MGVSLLLVPTRLPTAMAMALPPRNPPPPANASAVNSWLHSVAAPSTSAAATLRLHRRDARIASSAAPAAVSGQRQQRPGRPGQVNPKRSISHVKEKRLKERGGGSSCRLLLLVWYKAR